MSKINRLEEVFEEQNIYNRNIAQYLNVAESTVSRWVHNKQQPDLHKLNLIAEFLRVDIRDLLHPSDWSKSKVGRFVK
jgi:putative transcriptional regulator